VAQVAVAQLLVPEDPQDSAEAADSVALADLVEAELGAAGPTSRAFR